MTKWQRFKRQPLKFLKWYFTLPSETSFGWQPTLPLWKSVLSDYAYIFSFGLYKP